MASLVISLAPFTFALKTIRNDYRDKREEPRSNYTNYDELYIFCHGEILLPLYAANLTCMAYCQ